MRTLGLIGGISWVSTVDYYKMINEGVNEILGGLNYAQCVIYSFNYADIKANNDADDWDANFDLVSRACYHLKETGAEGIILCANTMHLIADRVEQSVGLPVIHIASATAGEVEKNGFKRIGLLGTKFTMERPFYSSKFNERNIEVLIPGTEDRDFLHYTIFEELGRGIFKADTKKRYLEIMDTLIAKGAEGIVLGCTEIPLLIDQGEVAVKIFDTTKIHCSAAINFMLNT